MVAACALALQAVNFPAGHSAVTPLYATARIVEIVLDVGDYRCNHAEKLRV